MTCTVEFYKVMLMAISDFTPLIYFSSNSFQPLLSLPPRQLGLYRILRPISHPFPSLTPSLSSIMSTIRPILFILFLNFHNSSRHDDTKSCVCRGCCSQVWVAVLVLGRRKCRWLFRSYVPAYGPPSDLYNQVRSFALNQCCVYRRIK